MNFKILISTLTAGSFAFFLSTSIAEASPTKTSVVRPSSLALELVLEQKTYKAEPFLLGNHLYTSSFGEGYYDYLGCFDVWTGKTVNHPRHLPAFDYSDYYRNSHRTRHLEIWPDGKFLVASTSTKRPTVLKDMVSIIPSDSDKVEDWKNFPIGTFQGFTSKPNQFVTSWESNLFLHSYVDGVVTAIGSLDLGKQPKAFSISKNKTLMAVVTGTQLQVVQLSPLAVLWKAELPRPAKPSEYESCSYGISSGSAKLVSSYECNCQNVWPNACEGAFTGAGLVVHDLLTGTVLSRKDWKDTTEGYDLTASESFISEDDSLVFATDASTMGWARAFDSNTMKTLYVDVTSESFNSHLYQFDPQSKLIFKETPRDSVDAGKIVVTDPLTGDSVNVSGIDTSGWDRITLKNGFLILAEEYFLRIYKVWQ